MTNLAVPGRVVPDGPFEHCSSLALIESTFGLAPLTARDRFARNVRDVLHPRPVPAPITASPSLIPTSSDVIGPAISPPWESLLQVLTGTAQFDPADICSADSVQSVSPAPLNEPPLPQAFGAIPRAARDLRHGRPVPELPRERGHGGLIYATRSRRRWPGRAARRGLTGEIRQQF